MSMFPVPSTPLELVLDTHKLSMTPKRFKSGSVGWYLSTKMELDGTRCQLSFCVTVVGSKPATAAEAKAVKDVEDSDQTVILFTESGREIIVPEPPQHPKRGKRSPKR